MRRREYLRASGLLAALGADCSTSDEQSTTETATESKVPTESTTSTQTATSTESATATEIESLDGWPMFGGNPAHTGTVTDDPPELSEPSRGWEYKISGGSGTGPAVSEDIVAVALAGGEIHAVDRSTGELIWETELEGAVTGQVIQNGTVYAGSNESEFAALDARTGEELWCYEFNPVDRVEGGNTVYTPAVTGDTAFAAIASSWDTLHAVDVADGTRRWAAEPTDLPEKPVIHGDDIYVAGSVVKGDSGDDVRKYDIDRDGYKFASAVTKDAVFIVDSSYSLYRFPKDGVSPEWEVSIPEAYAEAPVVANGMVYVSGLGFAATDGSKQFEIPSESRTRVAIAGDTGLLLRRQSLVAFDPTDGTVRWEEETGRVGLASQPAVDEDAAYVSTGKGLIAFE